ncbi:MAG: hypothetical protein ACFFCW_40125 [Candidatus Hodarchaeota archaeon]
MIANATPQLVVNFVTILNILAIILSIVALIITIVGFFASMKFYRDGMALQNLANDALVKIEEKASSIQTQVGGMFEKTLDAALSNREQVSTDFDKLNEELQRTGQQIVDTALKEIGTAGEEQRQKLQEAVNKELKPVQELIETTRQSAEQAASEVIYDVEMPQRIYLQTVLNVLDTSKPMNTLQIKKITGLPLSEIRNAIHYLLNLHLVERVIDKESKRSSFKLKKDTS